MTTLNQDDIRSLLAEYDAADLSDLAVDQIHLYLEAFEVWSKRVSLSTVREPAQVVRRHFGEGFALASILPQSGDLLDLGSGAGFPGIPIALAKPEMKVTLAEVQTKKAAFLREVTTRMQLEVGVWSRRAEELVGERKFDVVALRAVDNMPEALETAVNLLRTGGLLAFFISPQQQLELPKANWAVVERRALQGSAGGAMLARLA